MAQLIKHRLPHRWTGVVLPFLLSLVMTFVVSLIATIRALGVSTASLRSWPSAWALSWVIAFPTLLLVLPLVRRLVGWLVASPPRVTE